MDSLPAKFHYGRCPCCDRIIPIPAGVNKMHCCYCGEAFLTKAAAALYGFQEKVKFTEFRSDPVKEPLKSKVVEQPKIDTSIPRMMTIRAIAKEIGLAESAVRRMVKEGKLPYIRVVEFQHDGDTVHFPGQRCVRYQATGIGIVSRRRKSGLPETPLRCLRKGRRGKVWIRTDADFRRFPTLPEEVLWNNIIRIAVHVEKKDLLVLSANPVDLLVVLPVEDQCFLAKLVRHVFEARAVEGPLIAEAHAVALHDFLRAEETLHVAQQAADRETHALRGGPIQAGHKRPHPGVLHNHLFFNECKYITWENIDNLCKDVSLTLLTLRGPSLHGTRF